MYFLNQNIFMLKIIFHLVANTTFSCLTSVCSPGSGPGTLHCDSKKRRIVSPVPRLRDAACAEKFHCRSMGNSVLEELLL